MRHDLPVGITIEPGRGYLVEARVRPYPKRRTRFPLETPMDVMVAWRLAQIRELEAKRRAVIAMQVPERSSGRPRAGRIRLFRDDVETFIAEKLRLDMHPDTRAQFIRWLRKAAETDFGRIPRHELTGAQWSALVERWERYGIPATPGDGGRRRIVPPGPLSIDYRNKIRTCFIQFYEAMDRGLEVKNPARFIPWKKPADPEPRGIPLADALAILDQVGTQPTRTAARLTLMCTLGLRPVEIMRIQPGKDWHRSSRTLTVRTAKGGVARTLPLTTDRALEALQLLERLKGWGTFTSSPAARMFHTAVKKAGLAHLEPLRPYDLRHTFGTEAYRHTGDIKATSEALGHKNLKTTSRYTGAAVQERVAALFAAVDRATPRSKKRRHRGRLRAIK